MPEEFSTRKVLHGSKGYLFWAGRKVSGLLSAEIKLNGDWEDIKICGTTTTYHVYNGYEVDGTFTYLKTDSTFVRQLAEAFESGDWPALTVVTSIAQRGSNKMERVSISDIAVTELMLVKFEKGKNVEDTIPFKGGKFQVLEAIL